MPGERPLVEAGVLIAIGLVVTVLTVFALLAQRFPVLLRLGARNAVRRRTQTTVVVLGLMMGTAIISGSLASGDSLQFGIRKGAYDALGPVDVLIELEGQLHFPRVLYDDLRANRTVMANVAALAPILYEEAALANNATRQSEPRVSFIGIEPTANRAFGAFRTPDGRTLDGSDLGPNDIYLTQGLAASLGANVGDTLDVNHAKAFTPLLPRITVFDGALTASAGACPTPVAGAACQYVAGPTDPATFSIEVAPGAVAMSTIVAWFGPTAGQADLDQTLRAPDGAAYVNANGTPQAPDNPSVLNVTSPTGKLAPGNWSFEVRAKASVDQRFRAVSLVFYEEYNLTALQLFEDEARTAGLDPEAFLPSFDGSNGLTRAMTVRAVVTKEDFGDFLLGENMFAHIDTVARMYGVEDKINFIMVAGDLDTLKGAATIPRLLSVLPDAVNASAAAHPESVSLSNVKAIGVKSNFLETAERAGKLFTEFLTTVGGFTVVAGVMLIINIFVMLAEERKSELGMARAVGLSRRQLIILFSFEGLLYALVASVIGVALGLAIAWGMILGLNDAVSAGNDAAVFTIPFHVEPISLLYAFAAGFLITMATVVIASWRVSRLNVVRAIRRIEEPPRRTGNVAFGIGIALATGGIAWSAYAFSADDFIGKVLAPCIMLFGLGLMAARVAPRRYAYPIAGAAVASYALWSIFRLGNPDGMLNRLMGPVRGVLIVMAVVLIIIYLPHVVRWTAAGLLRFRALVPAVRPGIAYPLEKKTRTGLTVTMFALVILVVVAFSVFGATFTIDLKAQSGGYDVEGDATVPIGDLAAWFADNGEPGMADPLRPVARYDELRYTLAYGGRIIKIAGESVNYQGPPADYIYTYREAFARNNKYEFDQLDPAYATAADAYLAVLRDPGLIIVSQVYNFDSQGLPGRFSVGDTLTMATSAGEQSFRIIGFQKQFYLGGVFVHPQVLDGNFQRIRGEYLFTLHPGEDAIQAATAIEAAFQRVGMNAESIDVQAARQAEQNDRFLRLFQLFLGFGLVVGIASLGIVTARSVLERRQEIGMLRAVGYSTRDILKMFYIEIFFTTTLGILIGGTIGLFTSYGAVQSTPSLAALGVQFTVPWGDIALILLLVYVAVFLTTFVPAWRGSKTPPAEAVRYIE